MINLLLRERAKAGTDTYINNITSLARDWQRTTRAIGGYWLGDFIVGLDTLSQMDMIRFFEQYLGCKVIEKTSGIVTWEGEIAEMDLTVDDITYRRTLNPERWHNRVKVHYTDNTSSNATETAWAENSDSIDVYGESEYIDVVGDHYTSASAEALRDRRLTENAYPIAVPTGMAAQGTRTERDAPSLHVICQGYVFSMNRQYRETDTAAAAMSTQITTLVGESEFVTAGSIETNSDTVAISCSEVATRLWDLIDEFIAMGDTSGNRWAGGVYNGLKLDYKQAETSVTHYWRDGQLVDKRSKPVMPSIIRPDIIMQISSSFTGIIPPGGYVWSNPQNIYIEEVEFIYPDQFRLIPYQGI